MGEPAKTEKKKVSFWTGLKAEFKKIIWPDKDSLIKQTIAVVLISIALCLVITVLDTVISTGIGFLMK
ncbi:MAG: preprotein translocase subunit SecE [Lachnospiraceae bacterium]|nr:preprotein translocase subunit SecE [Cuneatibacter sp.]MDD6456395.1 preprotein translocase subunit SecE [Lachnospiraceae bacterium]